MKLALPGPAASPGNGLTNCATPNRTSTRSKTGSPLMQPGEIYLAQFPFGDSPGEALAGAAFDRRCWIRAGGAGRIHLIGYPDAVTVLRRAFRPDPTPFY